MLVALMVIIIILGSIFGTKRQKVVGLSDVVGQAQEINRVSAAEAASLKDPSVIALAATTQSALTSDQAQLKKYADAHKLKVDAKKIASFTDKTTDNTLAAAASNNALDAAYVSYLQAALKSYRAALMAAYDGTTDRGIKILLQSSYASAGTLLGSSNFTKS
jgi:hypothetical protein